MLPPYGQWVPRVRSASAGINPALKSQLVVGRLDGGNIGNQKWSLDVGSAFVVDTAQNFIRVDQPKSFGGWAIGLPSAFAPENAGVVGATLQVSRITRSTRGPSEAG